ncbi:MAG: hypothetical protein ACLS7Z_09360 [Christensenellales bacterium]
MFTALAWLRAASGDENMGAGVMLLGLAVRYAFGTAWFLWCTIEHRRHRSVDGAGGVFPTFSGLP